jgi:hypothetical protein
MSNGDIIQESLKAWLEENLPKFLVGVNDDLELDERWDMPTIEDYCLVVAVRDFKDGNGGIFSISDSNVPSYRITGLLSTALNS